MSIDELLKIIQRTNPTMTRKLLIEELGKNRYSSVALVMVLQNIRQEK